jgi:hypothetical protein
VPFNHYSTTHYCSGTCVPFNHYSTIHYCSRTCVPFNHYSTTPSHIKCKHTDVICRPATTHFSHTVCTLPQGGVRLNTVTFDRGVCHTGVLIKSLYKRRHIQMTGRRMCCKALRHSYRIVSVSHSQPMKLVSPTEL